MLVDAFRLTIFPYLLQLGAVMFVFAICSNAYSLFRTPNWQQFIDKMKCAIVAYAVVKGAFTILDFVDKIINNIKI